MSKILKSQLGLAPIIIVLIVAGALLLGAGAIYLYQQSKVGPEPEAAQPSIIQPESEISTETPKTEQPITDEITNQNKKMIVRIPTARFFDDKLGIDVKFKEYLVPKKRAVLSATLEKLFELNSNRITNRWEGFTFHSVSIKDSVATITLKGSLFPVGGMSTTFFRKKVESAAMQFDSVKDVRVFLVKDVRVLVDGKVFD